MTLRLDTATTAPDRLPFNVRLAEEYDQHGIATLMHMAIRKLQAPYLDEQQIEASFDIMGLDIVLIADRTYYLVMEGATLVGCGGWSRRTTLYGGSHSGGRDATPLDPSRDAARIRAMYTHPRHARRGIGRLILATCETAARLEGFRRVELVATLAGEPLYHACGYDVVEETTAPTATGVTIPVRRMAKEI